MAGTRSPLLGPHEQEQREQRSSQDQSGAKQAPQQNAPRQDGQQGRGEQPKAWFSGNLYVYYIGIIAALGGFLFGYDTGVISGAQAFLKKQFNLNATSQELAVAAVLFGTVAGAAISGKLADWLGRKWTLIVMAIIFIVGAIVTALSSSLAMFMAFRAVTGVAVGGASVVAPMYTTELAPPAKRGAMVFLFQFMVTMGILIAYAADIGFADYTGNWRPMFAVALIPGVLLGVGMFFLSDTPRWYASKGDWDKASDAMQRVAGDKTEQEMKRIRERLEQAKRTSVLELFRGPLLWALIAGVGLAVFQQFVGINTIIYYAPIIAGYSGFGGTGASGTDLIGALIIGGVNVAATAGALLIVDKIGRRKLLLRGRLAFCSRW